MYFWLWILTVIIVVLSGIYIGKLELKLKDARLAEGVIAKRCVELDGLTKKAEQARDTMIAESNHRYVKIQELEAEKNNYMMQICRLDAEKESLKVRDEVRLNSYRALSLERDRLVKNSEARSKRKAKETRDGNKRS